MNWYKSLYLRISASSYRKYFRKHNKLCFFSTCKYTSGL